MKQFDDILAEYRETVIESPELRSKHEEFASAKREDRKRRVVVQVVITTDAPLPQLHAMFEVLTRQQGAELRVFEEGQ